MSVGTICSRTTHLADGDESVQAAASRMKDANVGTLLVVAADRKPVGILTDRDVAIRVVAPGLDARRTKVGEVMSAHPRWVSEDAPIEEAIASMRGLGVRRLPVVDRRGRLVGLVSVDDVLAFVTEELGNLGRVVGVSRPGSGVPSTRAPRAERPLAAAGGGKLSSPDLEC